MVRAGAFAVLAVALGLSRDPGCGGAGDPQGGKNAPCTRNSDCRSDLKCSEGVCVAASTSSSSSGSTSSSGSSSGSTSSSSGTPLFDGGVGEDADVPVDSGSDASDDGG